MAAGNRIICPSPAAQQPSYLHHGHHRDWNDDDHFDDNRDDNENCDDILATTGNIHKSNIYEYYILCLPMTTMMIFYIYDRSIPVR